MYNAVYSISPDNNRLLLRGAFTDGGFNGKGVSISTLQANGRWGSPQMLNIKNYAKYDKGRVSGASMASDGQTILFYMSEEKGGSLNDIYVCFLEPDGSWTRTERALVKRSTARRLMRVLRIWPPTERRFILQ